MLDLNVAEAGFDAAAFVPLPEPEGLPAGPVAGLTILSVPDAELILVSKDRPGFDAGQVSAIRLLLDKLRREQAGACKFLVFEIGNTGATSPTCAIPSALLDDIASLVVDVPVIPIAWARDGVAASDLELALACSMVVAEPTARFSFDLDLVQSLRSYAVLAHKIGFVRAERLMEGGSELTTDQMSELMLLTAVVSAAGLEGVKAFVRGRVRRHNASCGIYRAQRRALARA